MASKWFKKERAGRAGEWQKGRISAAARAHTTKKNKQIKQKSDFEY